MSLVAATLATVAFLHGGNLVVLDVPGGTPRVVLRHAAAPVGWSGDGRLVSAGGRVAGGPSFPTAALKWAPTGETAAYQTTSGAVVVWSPRTGRRTVVPASWGARSLAWGPGGRLALGRRLETPGHPNQHQEVWVWRAGTLRKAVGPLPGDRQPLVAGFAADGRVLWWDDLFESGSIASDGLVLSAGTTRLATTLVFPDFAVHCGPDLALAAGGDRYTTKGKRILWDGRDVSRDPSRSWVSPACRGSTLVAAAGRSWWEPRIGHGERRSLWQLLPVRRRLTQPPAGATDEFPQVLADGSILFVRTRESARPAGSTYRVTDAATLELLRPGGRPTPVADLTYTSTDGSRDLPTNFYGHYAWPWLLAVRP